MQQSSNSTYVFFSHHPSVLPHSFLWQNLCFVPLFPPPLFLLSKFPALSSRSCMEQSPFQTCLPRKAYFPDKTQITPLFSWEFFSCSSCPRPTLRMPCCSSGNLSDPPRSESSTCDGGPAHIPSGNETPDQGTHSIPDTSTLAPA